MYANHGLKLFLIKQFNELCVLAFLCNTTIITETWEYLLFNSLHTCDYYLWALSLSLV